MADFCRQCSIELFGRDHGDLKGLISADDSANGYVSNVVICEGCGYIQVDHDGRCVSDCDKHHGSTSEADSIADAAEDQSERDKRQGPFS